MFYEDDDDKQHVSDTVEGIGEGIANASPSQVADEVGKDVAQTKDDAEDALLGEDGNNR